MAEPLVHRWSGGLQWIADPDEFLQRASHVLAGESGAWVIDPVDFDGLDELLAERDPVRGVALTLDRHQRDAAAVASRYEVAVYLPDPLMGMSDRLEAPIVPITAFLEDTGCTVDAVLDVPGWREVMIYHEDSETLIVGDSLGTAPYFSPATERLSVHPMLRLTPPRGAFEAVDAERVLVGHGEGVMSEGAAAIQEAFRRSRRGAPRAWVNALGHMPGPITWLRR